MIARVLILCFMAVQATAFLPESKPSSGLPKLTTVGIGASVAWDSEKAREQTPRLSWIRRPLQKLLQIKEKVQVHGSEAKLEEPTLVPQKAVVSVQENVVTKVHEFRPRPRVPSQPRHPVVEARLAAKYAKIESLEERAFQILVDLNMVELHN